MDERFEQSEKRFEQMDKRFDEALKRQDKHFLSMAAEFYRQQPGYSTGSLALSKLTRL